MAPPVGVSRHCMPAQKTRYVKPMSIYCWADVGDGGPTLNRHWFNVSRLLGARLAAAWLTDWSTQRTQDVEPVLV